MARFLHSTDILLIIVRSFSSLAMIFAAVLGFLSVKKTTLSFTTRISKATRLSRRNRRLIFAKTRRFSVGTSQWRVSLPCLNCAYDKKENKRNPPVKIASAFWHFLLFWQSPPLFHNFHHQWRDAL